MASTMRPCWCCCSYYCSCPIVALVTYNTAAHVHILYDCCCCCYCCCCCCLGCYCPCCCYCPCFASLLQGVLLLYCSLQHSVGKVFVSSNCPAILAKSLNLSIFSQLVANAAMDQGCNLMPVTLSWPNVHCLLVCILIHSAL